MSQDFSYSCREQIFRDLLRKHPGVEMSVNVLIVS